jgi:EAL domain-containing protein (putative c-di-GMP-specific phosphodiesterase class I)
MANRMLVSSLRIGRRKPSRSAEDRAVRGFVRDGLPMVFQPVLELESSDRVAVEALARFPVMPLQPPMVWFERAERLGLLVELELACVRSALRCLGELPNDVRLSINVSPRTAITTELAELVAPVGERIIIELTEHAPVEHYGLLKESIDRLRKSGAQIAVDDVGKGFANVPHVLRLSPDIVKLDRSLTREMETDSTARALVSGLVAHCKRIGATVVAEGIESQATLTLLRRLGIGQGQGYYLGYPGPLVGMQ